VRLEPPGDRWPALVRLSPQDNVTRATRRALGLVTHRRVVMGGHQPGFWHAGILAKWIAVETTAASIGGASAWVVPDQSPGAGTTIDYPAREGDRLVRASVRFGRSDVPPASQLPARFDPPTDAALSSISRGLAVAARLLREHESEPTLARQLHAACTAALSGLLPEARRTAAPAQPVSFFASELHETEAFRELVAAMRADPRACASHYNEAASEHRAAGVRELAIAPDAVELPLWERTGAATEPQPWRTIRSDRLPDVPDDRLVLRGLPMTGLLRRWCCDLFVHGTGGGGDAGYDRVTEAWFEAWLGARDLAPAVVASATLRLDFREFAGELDMPTPEQIARAQELAHRAEHDPALIGDEDLGRRKRELAQQIAALPRGSEKRGELFRQMQELRGSAGAKSAGELKRLQSRAESLAAHAEEAAIAAERTWPFLFHAADVITRLRDAIASEIGPAAD
jgi:hypothetical protein